MDIVFNIDDGYARFCGVVMSSVIRNNRKRPIHFHVLGLGLSEENKLKLRRVAGDDRLRISFYDIDPALVERLPALENHSSITAATYVRLFLTDYLPAELDKVLYLDCDLLVRGDLSELWDTDISRYALAGAEDVIRYSRHWLGKDDSAGYFNAGVMLINLRYWREHDALGQFMAFMEKHENEIVHHDQDVLNGVFFDQKLPVSIKWNTLAPFTGKKGREKFPEYYDKRVEDPSIVHFVGRRKPWNTTTPKKYYFEFYKYQLFTPWKFCGPFAERKKRFERAKKQA